MKENKFLVAYATMSGSTQEIAEFIGQAYKNKGIAVDVQRCREVSDLKEYSLVILGAPIYMFRLHKDALRFLQRFHKQLVDFPVAIFAGGPYGDHVDEDAIEVRKNLQTELDKFTWVKPLSVELVGGRFDPTLLRFPYNLIPALKTSPASDTRDWIEIESWAKSLPELVATQMTNR